MDLRRLCEMAFSIVAIASFLLCIQKCAQEKDFVVIQSNINLHFKQQGTAGSPVI